MSLVLDDSALMEPITADQPCGENLDDSSSLASFDSLRLFGAARPPEAPPDPEDQEKAKEPPDWGDLKAKSLEALTRSKDLRVLAYLATALLRTDGLPAYFRTLTIASQWLETYWATLYPPLEDGDAIFRKNALNCLADTMAVMDRLRRTPLVESRQHGRFSLRDIDMATGQTPVGPADTKPDEAAISAAFGEMPLDRLKALEQSVADGVKAIAAIDEKMRGEGGPEVAPDFETLTPLVGRLDRVLRLQIAARPDAVPEGEAAPGGDGAGEAGTAAGYRGGAIKSRQEALRALDAVVEYFKRNEPSSAVPLLVDRAKRLVGKDFLEVLADIAPDAVSVARAAGGLKEGE